MHLRVSQVWRDAQAAASGQNPHSRRWRAVVRLCAGMACLASPVQAAQSSSAIGQLGWITPASILAVMVLLALYFGQINHVRDLGAKRRRAESADKAKSAFLATMSHEIRTPLNGVIGIAGALSRTRLTVAQREMVDLILESGEVIERYLTDVLDLSRVEAGQLVIDAAPFALDRTIVSATLLMRQRAEDKGLAFRLDVDPALTGWFVGDAVRLRQIVTNLCSNAVKFCDSGGVRVMCGLVDQYDPQGRDWVRIEVSDTGRGFDEAFAEQLFARFSQADASARAHGGAGLGLSICQALTEAMGGTISASSTPGLGSCFTVELPLPRTEAPQAMEQHCGEGLNDAPAAGFGLKVLLVEHHPVNRQVMSVMLAPFATDVTVAESGRDALDLFISQAFDLVLMDQRMPMMDGLQATRAIREIEWRSGRERTPVILLTSESRATLSDRTEGAGADGRLVKPVKPSEMAAVLQWVGGLGDAGQPGWDEARRQGDMA